MRDGGAVTAAVLAEREHLRVDSDAGIVDLLRAGAAPLDFESVDAASIEATVDGVLIRVCGLASLVAFKRLAGRSRDRLDLEELRERHGGNCRCSTSRGSTTSRSEALSRSTPTSSSRVAAPAPPTSRATTTSAAFPTTCSSS